MIKIITYYKPLFKLFGEYNKALKLNNTPRTLKNKLDAKNAIAVGLYVEEVLRGFIIGFDISDKSIFHFSDIYVSEGYRYYVKDLLDYTEDYIRNQGYKAWTSSSRTEEGQRMLAKYKAREIEIKYYKEL